jgi:RHS repeat-associated protein
VEDDATKLTYMQQRYYDPVIGQFLSIDPITADGRAGRNFNRHWYANNNPYRFTDPDGRDVVVPWNAISRVVAERSTQAGIASQLDSPAPGPGDVAGAIILLAAVGEIGYKIYQANVSPDVPDGLVGEQDKSSRQQGNRQNSGPLSSANGGTGDAATDFDVLTGGQSGPAPEGAKYPAGTLVGDNGISLRPANGKDGPRIDIPAKGDKPHETLHYPKKEQ